MTRRLGRALAALWLGASIAAHAVPIAAPPATQASAPAASANWSHAFAAFGAPKYPRNFDHFEYADPKAPKGGTLRLKNPDRRTSFDKYNPFTTRGNSPAGLVILAFETLAVLSGDEPQTMYGLLAEELLVAPDKSSITFRLNPKARFSNGEPVTAEDVKFSFDSLSGKLASPAYQSAFAGVSAAVVLDERTIRFDLTDRSSDMLFTIGTNLYVFSRKWALGADGKPKKFDEIVTELPITSGAYTVGAIDPGRSIEFKRNPDHWARDLPVQRGFHNFDRIVYRYYKDDTVATEAFKAGEYDMVRVYGARTWNRQHKGPKWDDGRIKKELFETGFGQHMQAYDFNLRRPIFQDIRVREALGLTYDWETNNRYRQLQRANSVFNNSEFAAQGLPSPGELKLLEPFRAELPKEVFGPPFVAPRTDHDVNELRRNLLKARALLESAGWKLSDDGVLRNAKGEPFVIEYLAAAGQDISARMSPWRHNAEKLGIQIKDRSVDYALFDRRLVEFDFDMVTIVEQSFTLPAVADYVNLYSSKTADEKGSDNLRGVKSAAVDAVLVAMSQARTLEEFRDACRALDRIVMWSHWQVPELYSNSENTSYWNKFGIPEVRAKYFQIDYSPKLTTLMAWPLLTWWIKDPAKR